MAIELLTLTQLFAETSWWEQGVWPVEKGDEFDHKHYEDLRRRIWLLFNPRAGYIDLAAIWGYTSLDTGTGIYTTIPLNRYNWPGRLVPFTGIKQPGELQAYFKDSENVEALYVNSLPMDAVAVTNNLPVTGGTLNTYWKIMPNPNKYFDYAFNAGRPSINASNKWIITHHANLGTSCGSLPGYTAREQGHRYFPTSLDPKYQLIPRKVNTAIIKCHSKVEIARKHIMKWPRTHHNRSLDSSSYEPCLKGRHLNEYVKVGSEPWRLSEPENTPNYVDKLLNGAYQDHVVHACESLTTLVWPADITWRENFVHYNAVPWIGSGGPPYEWDVGAIVYVSDYNPGGNYPEECFFVCKGYHPLDANKKPGTSGGDAYWATPAYDPRWIPYNIEYPYMQDVLSDVIVANFVYTGFSSGEYWDCNGSTFELCLKTLGTFDWYWDDQYPFIPIWMYKFRTEPEGPLNEMPKPRGCWRRTWRHSMGRIVTGEAAMMWPGSLGYPPGYWTGRNEDYQRLKNRFIIDQTAYSAITIDATREHYRVVDVETLWSDAAAEYDVSHGEGSFARLLATHEKVCIKGSKDCYEIEHDLTNHLRYVLVQLRYVYAKFNATVFNYIDAVRKSTENRPPAGDKATSLEAYSWGKTLVESGVNFEFFPASQPNADSATPGLRGETNWVPSVSKWTAGLITTYTWLSKALVTITLYSGDEKELPSFPGLGEMLFHFKYASVWVHDVNASGEQGIYRNCEIGIAGKTFKPDDVFIEGGPFPWQYGFCGGATTWEGWLYNTFNDKWEYTLYYWMTPVEDWPPDGFYVVSESTIPKARWWMDGTVQLVDTGFLHGFRELQLDSVITSVFDDDPNNYIEVT